MSEEAEKPTEIGKNTENNNGKQKIIEFFSYLKQLQPELYILSLVHDM